MAAPKVPARTLLFVASAVIAFVVAAFFVSDGGSDAGATRYESASDVVAALGNEDVECREFKRLDAPQESIKDFGLCFLREDRQYESDIYVFEDATARDSWVAGFEGKTKMLVGPNWFITNGSEAELETLRSALGGEIR